MEYVYLFGEILLVLALVGLISVNIWLVMTALHAKNAVMSNAGRLYKRPLNASKNLVTTVKGIVQQETVRVKRVGVSVKEAAGAVKEATVEIKTAAQGVHPEELRPAISSVQNVSRILSLAAKFSQAAAKQGPLR